MLIEAEILILKLDDKIAHWQQCTEDPHNLANAVIVALSEVKAAVEESKTEGS